MRIRYTGPIWLLASLVLWGSAWAAGMRPDEIVVLFPGMGWSATNRAGWEVEIRAWVLEREPRTWSLSVLKTALGLGGLDLTPDEEAVFRERARWFLADNERGKRLKIEVAGQKLRLESTDAVGMSVNRIQLPAGRPPGADRHGSELPVRVILPAQDARMFTGTVHLVAGEGISVVSDIDDTIKVSEVRDRGALLRNTFLRPFRPVPGMKELYGGWGTRHGAVFHYVSASPWQLGPELLGWIQQAGLPHGTLHLKEFRWKDQRFLNLFDSPAQYKVPVIEGLLSTYPRRQFVLVGDSGEKDPEIYGALARRHSGQILRIFIRDVTGEKPESERYRKAFEGVSGDRWSVFLEPTELASPEIAYRDRSKNFRASAITRSDETQLR